MAINSISLITPTQITNQTDKLGVQATPYEAGKNFSNYLSNAIESVNNQQIQSDTFTQKLITGQDVDLHEVMIASQKASITLNATMEVRNKVIDAYQEIMRMSI